MTNIYAVDTCSLRDVGRIYPQDVFSSNGPRSWIMKLISVGILEVIPPIKDELKRDEEYTYKEVVEAEGSNKKELYIEKQVKNEVKKIKKQLGISKNTKGKGVDFVDLCLIAYALLHKRVVVTEEREQRTLPKESHNYKIPAVCKKINVECISLIELFRKLGVIFECNFTFEFEPTVS